MGNGQLDHPIADRRLANMASPHVGRERKHGAKRSPETPASRTRLHMALSQLYKREEPSPHDPSFQRMAVRDFI